MLRTQGVQVPSFYSWAACLLEKAWKTPLDQMNGLIFTNFHFDIPIFASFPPSLPFKNWMCQTCPDCLSIAYLSHEVVLENLHLNSTSRSS